MGNTVFAVLLAPQTRREFLVDPSVRWPSRGPRPCSVKQFTLLVDLPTSAT